MIRKDRIPGNRHSGGDSLKFPPPRPYTAYEAPASPDTAHFILRKNAYMFSSIRTRIVALCVAIVVIALAANAVLNYLIANSYNTDAIESTLDAVESGHADGIEGWIAANSQMIDSLQDAALQPDPLTAFKVGS